MAKIRRAARLVIQLGFVFALSIVCLLKLGHVYIIVAGLACVVAIVLLYDAHYRRLEARTEPIKLREHLDGAFWIILMSLLLGLFWPSVPLIVGVGRRRENDEIASDDEDDTKERRRVR